MCNLVVVLSVVVGLLRISMLGLCSSVWVSAIWCFFLVDSVRLCLFIGVLRLCGNCFISGVSFVVVIVVLICVGVVLVMVNVIFVVIVLLNR